jgi:hypothetical protein
MYRAWMSVEHTGLNTHTPEAGFTATGSACGCQLKKTSITQVCKSESAQAKTVSVLPDKESADNERTPTKHARMAQQQPMQPHNKSCSS